MKRYFLGAAAGYKVGAWRQLFVHGIEADRRALATYLKKRYQGSEAILTKNGRSALALALGAIFKEGDKVIVNGFTCYAVVEAVLAAGMVPVYADISAETLNFTTETLEKALGRTGSSPKSASDSDIRGIIIQNTLGIPVDIVAVEKFARRHNLTIIEDLAHSAGVLYPDGREVGTVGAATVLSFGKEKMVDTISGGAAVLRGAKTDALSKLPRASDYLRARWYPAFMAIYRGLARVKLAGPFMRCLLKLHFVERSADSRLDTTRKIAKFEARLALEQMRALKKTGEKPLRDFVLLDNRDEVLKKLRAAGYNFGGFWYEKPVSPARYYDKVKFPEAECPVATEVAAKIINFPTYYSAKELAPAVKIVREYGKVCTPVATGVKQARSKVPMARVKGAPAKVPVTGVESAKQARSKVPTAKTNEARRKVPVTGVKSTNGARRKVPTKRRLIQ